jgi:hypothetical protein
VKCLINLFLLPLSIVFSIRFAALNHTNFEYVKNLLQDGSNHGMLSTTEYLKIASASLQFTQLKERILNEQLGFMFETLNFMFEAYDRKITQLMESGIAEWIYNELFPMPMHVQPEEPKELSLKHLANWFWLWIGLMSIATLCFILELFMKPGKCRHGV